MTKHVGLIGKSASSAAVPLQTVRGRETNINKTDSKETLMFDCLLVSAASEIATRKPAEIRFRKAIGLKLQPEEFMNLKN